MIAEQTVPSEGDLLVVGGHRVGEAERVGEIVEVLTGTDGRHFRIRWENGHESVLYPGGDATVRRIPRPPAYEAAVRPLKEAGVHFDVLPHARTGSALDEAGALHVDPHTVAKTLVAEAGDTHVRAVLPASERLSLPKLRDAVAGDRVELLSETELAEAYPEFELGGVPPFGGRAGDRVVVDRRIAGLDRVLVEAGAHDVSVRLPASALVRLTDAAVADICVD